MIHYLISGIPSMLFEPIAICALIALVIALIAFWKHHGRFYWIIAGTLLFIFAWRLTCYYDGFSTRYSSILLYPAIILSAWFFVYLQEYAEKKGFLSSGKQNLIFVFCIGALTIASIAKTLRYNPYDDHTVKICKVLKKEINHRNYQLFCSVESEFERIAYYTKIPRDKVQYLDGNIASLKNILIWYQNSFDPLYFIFQLKKDESEPNVKLLKLSPDMGKWECIHREYTSRRKNKEIVLYRFIPAHPNVEIWEKLIPAMSPDNKCINGDFEKYITGNELKDRLAYYRKIKASDFYTAGARLFPQTWWLWVPTAVKDDSPEMALTKEQPITGKYSLEMNKGGITSAFIPKQDCIFSGFIRMKKDGIVYIQTCFWNIAAKRTDSMKTISVHGIVGKTYRFSIPVYEKDVPPNDKCIYITVQPHGHILMDQVQFIPVKKNPGKDNVKRQDIPSAKIKK